MREFVSNAFALLVSLLLPFLVLVAFAMIAFGFALIWFPLGFIIGGILLALIVADARRE